MGLIEVLVLVIVVALVAALGAWIARGRVGGTTTRITLQHSLQQIREVGELVAFRVITRQIITASEHPLGALGKWFTWFVSDKKIAIIAEYGIDFKYNLRDPAFQIEPTGERAFGIAMPPCRYQVTLRDLKIYDERGSRILPFLLGEVGEVGGFGEEDKNRLIQVARDQAEREAESLANDYEAEVQGSARRTVESLARGFGAAEVAVRFTAAPRQAAEVAVSEELARK